MEWAQLTGHKYICPLTGTRAVIELNTDDLRFVDNQQVLQYILHRSPWRVPMIKSCRYFDSLSKRLFLILILDFVFLSSRSSSYHLLSALLRLDLVSLTLTHLRLYHASSL